MNENYTYIFVHKDVKEIFKKLCEKEDRAQGSMIKVLCDYWIAGHKKV